MRRIINFSGGKSSALMTILLEPTENDIVLFCDTGREHALTYKFIENFEKYEGIKVHTAAYQHHKSPGLIGFDALNHHRVYLPNRIKRICTEELKVNTAKRYLRSIGIKPNDKDIEQHIGFRADEQHRVVRYKPTWSKVKTRFVLNEQGINKAMVNEFWDNKPYTLQIPSILGNCDLCFLKGKNAIIRILQHHPELADPWIHDEEEMSLRKNNGSASYFPDVTYRQLRDAAVNQKSLFDKGNLEIIVPAFNCSCTS